ncbi:MAG: cytochrome P450, partial [Nannocystaceae bacterium]
MQASRKTPPGPRPTGKISAVRLSYLARYARDPLGFVTRRFARFGDMYMIQTGKDQTFVTKSPEHLRTILRTRATAFGKPQIGLEKFLGQGLLNSNGDLWRRHRRMIQPAFHTAMLHSYADMMVEKSLEMGSAWTSGMQVNLATEFMRTTLRIVCASLFDHKIRDDDDDVGAAMMGFQDAFGGLNFIPAWLPTRKNRRSKQGLAAMDKIIFGLIDQRKKELAEDPKRKDSPDLLTQLLQIDDSDGLSSQALRDERVFDWLEARLRREINYAVSPSLCGKLAIEAGPAVTVNLTFETSADVEIGARTKLKGNLVARTIAHAFF